MMIFYYLHYFVLGMLVYHIMEAKPFLYVIGKSDTDPVKNMLIVRRTPVSYTHLAVFWHAGIKSFCQVKKIPHCVITVSYTHLS